MEKKNPAVAPEHTAVRVALWRALHVQVDPLPHVFVDDLGAQIVGEENWRSRSDMEINFSKSMRASIVVRARFVEELVAEAIDRRVAQYVILGAGLDTFAQRHSELVSKVRIFEVDQPGPQAWKQQRLQELGWEVPKNLHFVPVDFEAGEFWWQKLQDAGFDPAQPAIVVSTGVSMYLSRETNFATFQQMSKLAPGSTYATTYMLALDLLEGQERSVLEFVMNKASQSGTPFLSLFRPQEILDLAMGAGLKKVQSISAQDLYKKYLAQRTDALNAGTAECFLVAMT
ncbi:class I SAM-dependent methyltransferase [Bdellovibrio sp. GT3]|uniref:class I SAM-dependent methyltransferase n=1 Tax=Bdellovibrio sp. GT3 TaxID=3136282 RepID=UPI0030F1E597